MPRKATRKLPELNLGNETIGQRISRIRKGKGITQKELAASIGITQGLVSEYEHERIRLYDEMVSRFAIALKCSTDEILGLDKKSIQKEKPNFRITRSMRRIERLPVDEQNLVLDLLRAFLQNAELRSGITSERKRQQKNKISGKKKEQNKPQKQKKQASVKSILREKKDPYKWSVEEIEALEIFFPRSPSEIVLDAIPGKSWYQCLEEAKKLDIKRRFEEAPVKGRPKKKPKYNISKKKLSELLETALTIEEISKKLGTTPDIVRRSIFKWDL